MIDKSQYSLTVSSNKNNKFTNLNIKEKKTNIPLPLLFLLDQKNIPYILLFSYKHVITTILAKIAQKKNVYNRKP